ncbi:ABC transporter ATP-binding protein [Pikeienuella sp. HZG-20]|uniref:ABC transporter ATP-binding protein n=1 Tax=Paludibacillus litoralis TaxID=3133267 RepID=UPI0030EDCEFC
MTPDSSRSGPPSAGSDALLRVRDLVVRFPIPGGHHTAVDAVSFNVKPGEILGLVGESGSGKSVTATSLLRLIDPPGEIAGGSIELRGTDLLSLSERRMRPYRGGDISMIWQDPMASLNPVRKIGGQLAEAVRLHWRRVGTGRASDAAVRERILAGLRAVNLQDPEERVREYPHQLSGGMQQRVMIAMSLACDPSLLIADEPTTALDVTIQAQILELLVRLRNERDMAIILITHDLGVVAETCDRVAVMYAGQIVEQIQANRLFRRPRHPYTVGLLDSIPRRTTRRGELKSIPGAVPEAGSRVTGCRYHARCPRAMRICREVAPPAVEMDDGDSVRCHLYG